MLSAVAFNPYMSKSKAMVSKMPASSNEDFGPANIELSPAFTVKPVHLQFDLKGTLRRVLIENNILYAMRTTSIYRIDLSNPSVVTTYPLPQTKSEPKDCWLSPDGSNIIISYKDLTYFHLHDTYQKFKPLFKWKGLNVCSLTFLTPTESHDTESTLLCACDDESLYLGQITASSQDSKRDDKHLKQVYKSTEKPIGIATSNNGTRISLVTEVQILHWDAFELSFSELLVVLKAAPSAQKHAARLSPHSVFVHCSSWWTVIDAGNDSILYHSEDSSLNKSLPSAKSFSNLTLTSVVASTYHLMILNRKRDRISVINRLRNAQITEIDLDNIRTKLEPILGIALDFTGSTFWTYTANGIFEIVVTNESTSVWFDYYKLGEFDKALKCVEDGDPFARPKVDLIHIKQGYDLLQKGLFGSPVLESYPDSNAINLQIAGIKKLGELSEPFEKVCLMILNLQSGSNLDSLQFTVSSNPFLSNTLLIEYLLTKFKSATQMFNGLRQTVLSSWIVELLLRQLYSVRASNIMGLKTNEQSKLQAKGIEDEITSKLRTFLKHNGDVLERSCIYQTFKDLCLEDQLVFFADVSRDYEFLVHYHIEISEWDLALKALISLYVDDRSVGEKCALNTSALLLVNSPRQTVETWLKLEGLKFEDLLPAIMMYNKNNADLDFRENQTIKFMQRLIFDRSSKDSLVNNTLLSLIITYKKHSHESDIFLNKQLIRLLNQLRSDKEAYAPFDTDLILRLCLSYMRYEAAITILINEKALYFDALDLALKVKSVDMAELTLHRFGESMKAGRDESIKDKFGRIDLESDTHVSRKELWLRYSRSLIQDDQDRTLYKTILGKLSTKDQEDIETPVDEVSDEVRLKMILRYLYEFAARTDESMILTLKDLLGMFPETILVNKFKQEIFESLSDYNQNISALRGELEASLVTSQKLRAQIQEQLSESHKGKVLAIIEPGEPCRLCHNLLINRNFIFFPNCQHAFHRDCIARYFLQHGNYHFEKIFQKFKKNKEQAQKEEIDSLIMAECILCSVSSVNSIDDDLLSDSVNLGTDWEL